MHVTGWNFQLAFASPVQELVQCSKWTEQDLNLLLVCRSLNVTIPWSRHKHDKTGLTTLIKGSWGYNPPHLLVTWAVYITQSVFSQQFCVWWHTIQELIYLCKKTDNKWTGHTKSQWFAWHWQGCHFTSVILHCTSPPYMYLYITWSLLSIAAFDFRNRWIKIIT